MQAVALLLRLVLALVFLTAGAAKLADLDASRDTVEAFGVTLRVARVAGTLLPLAELLVATALLVQQSARWAAACAILLLAAFSGGVAFALSRGRTPECNCFGQLSSQRIGPRTLLRNASFAALAAVVLAYGAGHSLGGWTGNARAADLVASIAVIVAALSAIVTLSLYGEQRRVLRAGAQQPAGASVAAGGDGGEAQVMLSVGEPAPDFTLADASEAQVSLASLTARGLPVLLVFASPSCGPCQRLLPQLARWSSSLRERLVIAVVESTVQDGASLDGYLPVREELVLLYEPGFALAGAYGVGQTPTGLVIGPDGRLQSTPHTGAGAIERLVRSTLKRSAQPAPAVA